MPGVKAILPTLRRRLSTGDIFKPARKLVRLFLHIRKDFITRVASKNVWVILAPSNGLIAIMNWFQKVSLNEMSGKVLTSPREMVIKTMAAGLERYSETNKRTEEIRNNKP